MEKAIQEFPKQFLWEPEIQNAGAFGEYSRAVLVGMGGSHLAADIMLSVKPDISLQVHADYGLPHIPEPQKTLIIASSYSGNTEEVLDAYEGVRKQNLPLSAISIGGKLLEAARKDGIPFIQMPDWGLQPRAALGFSFRALARFLNQEEILKESRALASLDVQKAKAAGWDIAAFFSDGIPLIYASSRNAGIAHIWKIKLNEGAKIPAFDNMFPELNHNEMSGFDAAPKTKKISEHFRFLFLRDGEDSERMARRMDMTEELLKARGFPVFGSSFQGASRLEKIFSSLMIADRVAFLLAKQYGVDPENVQMIEDLKMRMKI